MTAPRAAGPRRRRSPGPGPTPEALLRALDLSIGRRIRGLVAGEFRAHDLGGGTELAQVRPYEPGDDVRRIDWNVTARMHQPARPGPRPGARAHLVAPARRLAVDGVRHRRPPQGGRRRGRRDRDRPPVHAARQPARRAHVRRRDGPPVATARRPGRAARDAGRRRARGRAARETGFKSPESPPLRFVAHGAPAGGPGRPRLRPPRPARLAAAAGRRRPAPQRARRRDPRSARGRAARRRRAHARRRRDRPRGPRRHLVADAPRPGSPRPPPAIATTSPASSARLRVAPRRPVHLRQLAAIARDQLRLQGMVP